MRFSFFDSPSSVCFAVSERFELKDRYQGWVQAAPEFSFMIEDIDDLVDPRHLYDCCFGPEPSAHVLKKILWKEKNMHGLSSLLFIFYFLFLRSSSFSLIF